MATCECICGSKDLIAIYAGVPDFLRCLECRSLIARRVPGVREVPGLPWEEMQTTLEYKEALSYRRRIQAKAIVSLTCSDQQNQRLLDYGCGQGALITEARDRGLPIVGCDLNPQIQSDHVSKLNQPWELPVGNWDTIFMLDVLEHHPNPSSFLASLRTRRIVLKVPYARGPFAKAAVLLARLGQPHLLRRLFLVNDNSPHCWIPTRTGLKRLLLKSGFGEIRFHFIADVGTELPRRLRLGSSWGAKLLSYGATFSGGLMAILGNHWSDSILLVASTKEDS